ncbi:hypothetical protein V8C42DRAFT_96413 [Trichoderma barbatum]
MAVGASLLQTLILFLFVSPLFSALSTSFVLIMGGRFVLYFLPCFIDCRLDTFSWDSDWIKVFQLQRITAAYTVAISRFLPPLTEIIPRHAQAPWHCTVTHYEDLRLLEEAFERFFLSSFSFLTLAGFMYGYESMDMYGYDG